MLVTQKQLESMKKVGVALAKHQLGKANATPILPY
jgi:hypothetical protein